MAEQKKRSLGSRLFLFLFWVLVLLAAVLYGTTFRHTGENGMARVTLAEEPWLQKFERLEKGMDYEQVVAILGEPDSAAGTNRPTWRVAGSPVNRIAVYFADGKARRIFWMHLGRFALSR